jgi:hypothetical protein
MGVVTGAMSVVVNSLDSSIMGETFMVEDVPLVEGTNAIIATAQNSIGETATATINIRRDNTPPVIVIESPDDGDRLVMDKVTVAGTVNDLIPGATVNADDVTVTVNGMPAAVMNRTFMLPDLPLALGANTITAEAVDRVGNMKSHTIMVSREPDLAGIQIVVAGGNAQRGPINTTLPTPLAVKLQDSQGMPFAGRPVVFAVDRGDGLLGDVMQRMREQTLLTDTNGFASIIFTLGSRTGEGFHRVRATTPGSLTFADFCATGETQPPSVLLQSVLEFSAVRVSVDPQRKENSNGQGPTAAFHGPGEGGDSASAFAGEGPGVGSVRGARTSSDRLLSLAEGLV